MYAVLGLLILAAILRPLRTLWIHRPREARIGLAGAGVFVAGAVVLEIISYLYFRADLTSVNYKLLVAGEEFLEMAGVSIILYGSLLLAHSVSAGAPPSPRDRHPEPKR
ncbi:MAG: hypothetical protein H0T05_04105 [Acidobacteria bacterium]|nr:hypothetical protein [Acidobacteriota bacterium]MBA3886518.1 hypothetical protein [Acidobacteriota bacterium]